MPLPPLLQVPDIRERLLAVFPEGTPNRNYVTREIAAKTVFVMLYIGAVYGVDRWLRPDQVTRMSDDQASLADDQDRVAWLADSMRPAADHIQGRWFAANTREPIRDETLREGLVRLGAVREGETAVDSPHSRAAGGAPRQGMVSKSFAEWNLTWMTAEIRSGTFGYALNAL